MQNLKVLMLVNLIGVYLVMTLMMVLGYFGHKPPRVTGPQLTATL